MMLFNNIYENRRVFITGHTGFQGGWLSTWLEQLGAFVCGYSNSRGIAPNHYSLLNIEMLNHEGDIRDYPRLRNLMANFQPEIVFHLASESSVRTIRRNPLPVFSSNIQGTVNVLEAARTIDSVQSVVIVRSDQSYENFMCGYAPGFEPYFVSGTSADPIAESYRKTFYRDAGILLANCRSDNLIGGGDRKTGRLIPDLVRSVVENERISIPGSNMRFSWMHVLDALSGYLSLGEKLLEGRSEFADSWNFCSGPEDCASASEVFGSASRCWSDLRANIETEAGYSEPVLHLPDNLKAKTRLNWKPLWNLNESIRESIDWYKRFHLHGELPSWEQLDNYVESAFERGAGWTIPGLISPRIARAA